MPIFSAVLRASRLLARGDRWRLALATIGMFLLGVLDLLGVLLLGVVAGVGMASFQGSAPPSFVTQILDTLRLSDLGPVRTEVVLASLALVTLLAKTLVSAAVLYRVLRFLANRQAAVAASLTARLFSQPLAVVVERSSQQVAYSLTSGVASATVVLLGQAVVAVSEVGLLLILGAALLFIDPWVTLIALGYFMLVALLLQRTIGGLATRAGRGNAETYVAGFDAIQEGISAYREVTVSGRRSAYVGRISRNRSQAARFGAQLQYIAQLPKFILEGALVIGLGLLGAVLLFTRPPVEAVALIVLFLTASTRILPSLMRMQAAALQMRIALADASSALELSELLARLRQPEVLALDSALPQMTGHVGFQADVHVRGVTVTYPDARVAAVCDVNLFVPAGTSVAIVGSSGAGKSTLADAILGVTEPEQGSVEISGLAPLDCVRRWPGAIAYVPQSVTLANASVRENVALGIDPAVIEDDHVWECLERAHASVFVRGLPEGLDTHVGERGTKLSGGQRQRIGLARALYSNPSLIVLDEATSALDSETEHAISNMMQELDGQVTTITIAHRLATIRHARQVVFMANGRVVAVGTFDEVRKAVPDFEVQASLLGL